MLFEEEEDLCDLNRSFLALLLSCNACFLFCFLFIYLVPCCRVVEFFFFFFFSSKLLDFIPELKMASALLLVVVFVIDLIAFALAVAAEQRRASATVAKNATSNYCVYESDIATGFGVGALLLLLASQLLIMVASRCLCCGRALSPGRSRACAIFLFITCWVTFLIAEVCLLAGSVRNAYHTKYRTLLSQDPPSCETLRKGVFGAGAAFIIFTGIVSELFYVSYSKANDGILPSSRDTGIRMGAFN